MDDHAAAAGAHARHEQPVEPDRGQQVGRDHRLPLLVGDRAYPAGDRHDAAGVVDQHVDLAEHLLRFAGRQVGRDVWIAALPLAALARLSRLFRWLPKDRRGAAAAATVTLAAAMLLI
jgi:hypothetical protein